MTDSEALTPGRASSESNRMLASSKSLMSRSLHVLAEQMLKTLIGRIRNQILQASPLFLHPLRGSELLPAGIQKGHLDRLPYQRGLGNPASGVFVIEGLVHFIRKLQGDRRHAETELPNHPKSITSMSRQPVGAGAVFDEDRHAVRQRQRVLHEIEKLWDESFLFL